jgi:hypothetical protein
MKLTTHFHLVLRSKNTWSYASIPQYTFMAWFSVKAEGQLYLYFAFSLHLRDKVSYPYKTTGKRH